METVRNIKNACLAGGSRLLALFVILLTLVAFDYSAANAQNSNVRPPANAVGISQDAEAKKGGAEYDINFWRQIRKGVVGNVSIPDKNAAVLVQSEGENWRLLRGGPMLSYGYYAMAGMLALLALFFLLRGRIRIDAGRSATTITRFGDAERMGHWILAVSFIVLALSGLNLTYGKHFLLPLIGKEAFASITITGKWLHNYMGFAFMVGLLWTLVLWVKHNLPSRYDFIWLLKGGGMFTKGSHPPAKKFNAGQKILFWLIILGGISISLSGLSLLFPFEFPMFAKTFALMNGFGFNLPTELTAIEEMQYASSWHLIVALFLICVVFGHIYIGTLGMEGAFDAMGSGEVDANWAKEHHSVWYEEEMARRSGRAPAE